MKFIFACFNVFISPVFVWILTKAVYGKPKGSKSPAQVSMYVCKCIQLCMHPSVPLCWWVCWFCWSCCSVFWFRESSKNWFQIRCTNSCSSVTGVLPCFQGTKITFPKRGWRKEGQSTMMLLPGSMRACHCVIGVCECVSSIVQLFGVHCEWMHGCRCGVSCKQTPRKCVYESMMRCVWCVQLQSSSSHQLYFINERLCSEQMLPPLPFLSPCISLSGSLTVPHPRSALPLLLRSLIFLLQSMVAPPSLSLYLPPSIYLTSQLIHLMISFYVLLNCPKEDWKGQEHPKYVSTTHYGACV